VLIISSDKSPNELSAMTTVLRVTTSNIFFSAESILKEERTTRRGQGV
jgi:hypothetical protein